jgi:cytochrome c peroxidase
MESRARRRRTNWGVALALLGALGAPSAAPWLFAEPATPAAISASFDALKAGYRRPSAIPFPEENQYTKERELLGRTLFFDPRLSASGTMSCSTCHNPGFAWGDGLARAVGHGMKRLDRRTPTVLNLAWAERLFWDGRAASLEEQALGPIQSPGEMNMPLPRALAMLGGIAGYRTMFELAYPGQGITADTLGKAIATFERTVVSGIAPFDEWVAGREAAIPESARRGFLLFNAKANCAKCHTGWSFTDHSFHDVGMADGDLGRGKLLPSIGRMQYAFKTPTLRNTAGRRPYMHDGSVATLEEVVHYYDRGGDVKRPSLSLEIRPLGLSAAEKQDLLAFLDTLTSVDTPVQIPDLPR